MADIRITGITNADESIGSGFGGIVTVALSLSEPVADVVTVNYRTLSGTAQEDVDFPRSVGAITFAPNETIQTLDIRVRSDNADEPDEAFVIEMFDPVGAALEGDAPVLRATAFVLDDDGIGADRTIFVGAPVLVEGDSGETLAEFEVTLSRPSANRLTFDYATVDGSARAGQDYTAMSEEVTFLPGQTSQTIRVPVSGDATSEPAETFFLSIEPTADLADGGIGATGMATILDDDADSLPVLQVDATNAWESIGSGFGGIATFTFTLSEPTANAVSVDYRALPATAIDAIDYPATTDTLVFAPGETSRTVNIRVLSDRIDEVDEAFVLQVTDPENAVFAGGQTVLRETSFVLDTDGVGPNRALFVSSPVVREGDDGDTRIDFEITLSRPSDVALEFDYALKDGNAEAGSDFEGGSGTVTFSPGQTQTTVTVFANGDETSEATEFFHLEVTPGAGIFDGGTGATGTATLLDDDSGDGVPVISMEATNAWESIGSGFGGVSYFTVSLSEASVNEVRVDYSTIQGTALLGTDLPSRSDTLVFAPGETSRIIGPRVTSDRIDEADESFYLQLDSPRNAVLAGGATALRATSFVQDTDGLGPNLVFDVADVFTSEVRGGAPGTAEFVVSLSRAQDEAVTLTYATSDDTAIAGQDYVAQSGRVTFAPGQTEAAITIDLLDNDNFEDAEQFFLSFEAPPNTFDSAFTGAFGIAQISDGDQGGTDGDDLLVGFDGREDGLDGRGGNDTLRGLGDDDILLGGDGNDSLDGGPGADRMEGGEGDDVYVVDDRRDLVRDDGGTDTAEISERFAVRRTGVERVEIADGTDNVWIIGDQGATEMVGGDGDDVLISGGGADTMTGGDGADFFAFVRSGPAPAVVIEDFDASDKLVFDDQYFGQGNRRVDLRQMERSEVRDLLRDGLADYDFANRQLLIDIDGPGGPGGLEVVITFEGRPQLGLDDIFLI